MSDTANSNLRSLPRGLDVGVKALGALLVAAAALYSLNVHEELGYAIYPQQFFGLMLGLTLFITLTLFPMRKGWRARRAVFWVDLALALAGLACGLFLVFRYPVVANIQFPTAEKVVFGTIAVFLVIEASRRIYGLVLPAIAAIFLVYALFADHFPGLLETRGVEWDALFNELYIGDEGLLGIAFVIISTIVVVFILFGQLLFAMGGGTLFTDLATAAMGRYRGGPAKVAVVGSALFGSISGSAIANVVITGTVTIPLMKRVGYRSEIAAAIEATASTGGLVTPPVMSAVAFLMAELLGRSYGEIIIAATIPAVLYYAAILIQIDLEAGRRGMKGLPEAEIPRVWTVLKTGWPYLLPLPVLIYTLVAMNWQPAKSGMFAVLILMVTGFWFVRDKKLRWWFDLIGRIGVSATEILAIGALVGIVLGAAASTGLSFTLTLPLVQLGEINVFLLLLVTAVISIILGMGLPGIAIYFMQVTLIVPALVKLDIVPIAAHFFIYYFGVFSLITPPVCVAPIAAAGIAGARPMATGWEAVKLGIVAFIVPFVFVFSPSLLAQGPIWMVVANLVLSILGVIAISVGLRGYLFARVPPLHRIAFAAAAVALFVPLDDLTMVEFALNGVGLALLAAGTLANRARARPGAAAGGSSGQQIGRPLPGAGR